MYYLYNWFGFLAFGEKRTNFTETVRDILEHILVLAGNIFIKGIMLVTCSLTDKIDQDQSGGKTLGFA